jgi:nucleotide-binding universal stress UspA family protein
MDPKTIKRIVVATDFTELSSEAVETAVAFAHECGATLDLVHVASEMAFAVPPPMEMVTVPFDVAGAVRDASQRMSVEEERVRARGVQCESNVLVGRADAEIVEHADKTHTDLIVMGTHGRSGLPHVLLGSVAERVVQHAHCPVLTVPLKHLPQQAGTGAPTSPGR